MAEQKKAGVFQLPVSDGDMICPDLSSLVPMGVAQTIAGGHGKLVLEPVLVRCMRAACAQWDDERKQCGKLTGKPYAPDFVDMGTGSSSLPPVT